MARQGAAKGGEKGAGETRVTRQASRKVLPVGLCSRAAHPRPPRSRAPLPLQDPNFPSHPSEATSLVPPPVQISDMELCLSRKGREEWGSFPRRPGDSRCSDSRSGGCKRTVSPGPDQSFLQNCSGQGMTQELGVPISGAGGWSRPRGTIHKVTAEPDPGGKRPARGGGAALGTRPLSTPAQLCVEPGIRGSPVPGSPACFRDSQPRRGVNPSPPARQPGRGGSPGR